MSQVNSAEVDAVRIRLEKLNQDEDVDNQADAASREREKSIRRCIASVEHASQCPEDNCRRMSCHNMKKVIAHTNSCDKVNCGICKQTMNLLTHHAKQCVQDICGVPQCMNIQQNMAMNEKH